jgi:hypothetical protein
MSKRPRQQRRNRNQEISIVGGPPKSGIPNRKKPTRIPGFVDDIETPMGEGRRHSRPKCFPWFARPTAGDAPKFRGPNMFDEH